MPVPIFWICIGITSVALGTIVCLEAVHRYNEFREWQEYQQYAYNYQSSASQNGPSHHKKDDSQDGEDDDDDNDDKNKKAFVRQLNEENELRRRPLRQADSPLDTSEPGQSNRPVSDQGWVDRTDYELNELEKKLTDRKRHLEMEQELLDKAEMDIERRRQSLEQRGSDIHDRMNSLYSSSPSSSMLSSKTSTTKSLDSHELTKDSLPRLSASKNSRSSTNLPTPEEHQNNKVDDDSLGASQNSSASFLSALPLSSQPITNDPKTPTTTLTQPPSVDDTIDMKEGSPWVFQEEEDDNDGDDDIINRDESMQFPASSSSSSTTDHHDNHSVSIKSVSDLDGSWNDVQSISSRATHLSSTAGRDHLRSPSPPPSSSDGHSYDSVHYSDIENGH